MLEFMAAHGLRIAICAQAGCFAPFCAYDSSGHLLINLCYCLSCKFEPDPCVATNTFRFYRRRLNKGCTCPRRFNTISIKVNNLRRNGTLNSERSRRRGCRCLLIFIEASSSFRYWTSLQPHISSAVADPRSEIPEPSKANRSSNLLEESDDVKVIMNVQQCQT